MNEIENKNRRDLNAAKKPVDSSSGSFGNGGDIVDEIEGGFEDIIQRGASGEKEKDQKNQSVGDLISNFITNKASTASGTPKNEKKGNDRSVEDIKKDQKDLEDSKKELANTQADVTGGVNAKKEDTQRDAVKRATGAGIASMAKGAIKTPIKAMLQAIPFTRPIANPLSKFISNKVAINPEENKNRSEAASIAKEKIDLQQERQELEQEKDRLDQEIGDDASNLQTINQANKKEASIGGDIENSLKENNIKRILDSMKKMSSVNNASPLNKNLTKDQIETRKNERSMIESRLVGNQSEQDISDLSLGHNMKTQGALGSVKNESADASRQLQELKQAALKINEPVDNPVEDKSELDKLKGAKKNKKIMIMGFPILGCFAGCGCFFMVFVVIISIFNASNPVNWFK